MFKPVLATLILLGAAVSAMATNLTGRFVWVSGTVVTSFNITATAQTVVLKVGTTNKTFTNTFVPGPVGNPVTAGTPIQLLEAGSIPFGGSYKTGSVALSSNMYYGSLSAYRRPVPLTSAGAINANIATVVDPFSNGGMSFILPDVTVSNLQFVNGVSLDLSVAIGSYSVLVPTGTTTSFSFVPFPAGTVAPLSFIFSADGNGSLSIAGSGVGASLAVAGNQMGTPTIFTTASLSVGSGS